MKSPLFNKQKILYKNSSTNTIKEIPTHSLVKCKLSIKP